MRLSGLKPAWIATDSDRYGMGVAIDCPCEKCLASKFHARLQLWFSNPLDGGEPAHSSVLPEMRWFREGDDFHGLTVTPNIDVFGHKVHGLVVVDGMVF